MRENYIYCILTKTNTINLVRFCNAIEYESDDETDFFNRSTTWDDIKLVIPFKYFFELIERINLGRTEGITIDQILSTIKKSENEICMEFEMFEEDFILKMIEQNYHLYKDSYGNLSNSLPFIINNRIESLDKLIK